MPEPEVLDNRDCEGQVPGLNPYVGPRSFDEEHSCYFFGRDEEQRQLTSLIIAHRVVLFYAQSGAGKTSLLRASVIPEVRRRKNVVVLPSARVGGELPPGVAGDQVANIYVFNVLLKLAGAGAEPGKLAGLSLREGLAAHVQPEAGERRPRPRLLILDQFEELFTGHPQRAAERAGFFRQLADCLATYPQLSLLLSMREDYIARLDFYAAQMPNRLRTRFRMRRLPVAGALEAVQKPAERAGRPFEPGVAEGLVDNLRRIQVGAAREDVEQQTALGEFVEPVHLQIVCWQLWENLPSGGDTIRAQDVRAFGDVDQALSGFYEGALQEVAEQTGIGLRRVRAWFDEQLITPAETRGLVYRGREESGGLPNEAVELLNDAYIIRPVIRGADTWYELAHDRLVEPILASNRTWRETHMSPLQRQAELWEEQGRPAGLLLRDEALVDAEKWASANEAELTEVERAFLRRCREARAVAIREQRQSRLIKVLLGVASVVAVVAIVAAVLAIYGQIQARDARATAESSAAEAQWQRDIADQQRKLAVENAARWLSVQAISSYERRMGIDLSLLLAVEATRFTRDVGLSAVLEADDALRRALAVAPRVILHHHGRQVRHVAFNLDGTRLVTLGGPWVARLWDPASGEEIAVLRHGNWVFAAAFNPDGTQLATCSADRTAHLWDAATGQELAVLNHEGEVRSILFSPDGTWLVTGSKDSTARLWDAETGTELAVLQHESPVLHTVLSPDGTLLATSSEDGTAHLWDLPEQPSTGSSVEEAAILQHEGTVLGIAFSPDGRLVATASADGTARLWDVASGNELATLSHGGVVQEVAFNAPGTELATRSDDGTVHLWSVLTALDTGGSGAELVVLRHRDKVNGLAFSPDGTRLATASADSTAYLVDTATWEEPAVLRHGSPVEKVVFDPKGTWLVTSTSDGTVHVWDAATGRKLGALQHEQTIQDVAFSPDGSHLATASNDGTARLWYHASGVEPKSLHHEDEVFEIPFSPDGAVLATGSKDGTARLWDTATGEQLAILHHDRPTLHAIFSPDGTQLATGSDDGTVRLWETDTGKELHVLHHQDPVAELAFSPDGGYLATACSDGNARLWDAVSGEELAILAHEGPALHVTFSWDGTWLASSSADGTARVWDVAGALETGGTQAAAIVVRHGAPVYGTDFSPDGLLLSTASQDGTARLWDMATGEKVRVLEHPRAVWQTVFSPDGAQVATFGADSAARLWDTATGKQLALLQHEEGPVHDVVFSLDGTQVATASQDGTARLWDAASGKQLDIFRQESIVWRVSLSPDEMRLATGSDDGTARLWQVNIEDLVPVACESANRNLTYAEWTQFLGDAPYRATCPTVPLDPAEVRSAVENYLLAGSTEQGAAYLTQAVTLATETDDPGLSNHVCRSGSIDGLAKIVLPACEHAVRLAGDEDLASFRDSRGLARALMGDYAGAIEDLQFYVQWAQENDVSEEEVAQRQAWIAELEARRNPFDEQTLESLRKD